MATSSFKSLSTFAKADFFYVSLYAQSLVILHMKQKHNLHVYWCTKLTYATLSSKMQLEEGRQNKGPLTTLVSLVGKYGNILQTLFII